ncbi:hypothetical protein ES708_00277 [subsurface metagenome]
MPEERDYKITCDVCGYSKEVPSSRLIYEEGKTCPRCYRGKMYWVPPAEEARRREVRSGAMPEEERRISIAWAIPPILLLAVGGGLGLIYAMTREEEAPPEEGPPPGLANLYGKVTDAETGYPLEGVRVSINGLTTYTNGSGYYGFEGLTPGSYTITFEKEGYETEVR